MLEDKEQLGEILDFMGAEGDFNSDLSPLIPVLRRNSFKNDSDSDPDSDDIEEDSLGGGGSPEPIPAGNKTP